MSVLPGVGLSTSSASIAPQPADHWFRIVIVGAGPIQSTSEEAMSSIQNTSVDAALVRPPNRQPPGRVEPVLDVAPVATTSVAVVESAELNNRSSAEPVLAEYVTFASMRTHWPVATVADVVPMMVLSWSSMSTVPSVWTRTRIRITFKWSRTYATLTFWLGSADSHRYHRIQPVADAWSAPSVHRHCEVVPPAMSTRIDSVPAWWCALS